MLKPNVLRRKKDFSTIYNKGKSIGERYVVLFCRKNNLEYNRTAFLASKKVGNSVLRNRARRLMKESYRELEQDLNTGYDIIWIARNTICNLKCADVKKSMEAAVRKSGIKQRTNR
jgi:ribonuclease P protein component